MSDVDPNHWSSWTDTPPPSSHTEPGVPQAMTLAAAELPERFPLDAEPDRLGTTERDAAGKMVLHLCDPACHGAAHEEWLAATGRSVSVSGGLDPKAPSMRMWHALLAGGASTDEATELMHGYAHELAEKQRAAAKAGFERDVYIDELSMRFMGTVIDSIDPAAKGAVR